MVGYGISWGRARQQPRRKPAPEPEINLLTPSPYEIPAPRPFPTRRWEEIDRIGVQVNEDMIRSMKYDDLHRDIFSVDDRVAMFKKAKAMHLRSREHNCGAPTGRGLYIFSAGMGEGKSHLMATIAFMAYCNRGVPVFSPDSAGLLFGQRLSLPQMYQFSDSLPQGSILVVDEVSALADAYGGQATRARTLSATMTSFRKEGTLLLAGSAAEWAINNALRVSAEGVVTPSKFRPVKNVIVGYDSSFKPQYRRYYLRDHELEYPDWCYTKARFLKTPWERLRVRDDYERKLREAEMKRAGRKVEESDTHGWHDMKFATPGADVMYQSAGLYDSYSRVPISDQHLITADMMKAEAEKRQLEGGGAIAPADSVAAFFRWSIGTTLYDEYWGKGKISFEELHRTAGSYDRKVFRRMPVSRFKKIVSEVLPGGTCTARLVNLEGIVEFCQSRSS